MVMCTLGNIKTAKRAARANTHMPMEMFTMAIGIITTRAARASTHMPMEKRTMVIGRMTKAMVKAQTLGLVVLSTLGNIKTARGAARANTHMPMEMFTMAIGII